MEGVTFYHAEVLNAAAKGSRRALFQAAGYLRSVMRHSIKKRRYGVASAPGSPPYGHSEKLKGAFQFAMAPDQSYAVVGPMRLREKPANASGVPVPGILERGGRAAPEEAPLWYHYRGVAPMRSLGEVADYLLRQGYGPIAAGESAGAVEAKMGRPPKARWSPVLKKEIYLGEVKLKTMAQAMKAAESVVRYFGFPGLGGDRAPYVAPRPYVVPAMASAAKAGKLARFWSNSLAK